MESKKAYADRRYKRKQRIKKIHYINRNKVLNNDISEINIGNNKNNKINDNIISNEDNKNNFKNKSLDEAKSKDNNNFKSCEIHQIKSINIIKEIFKFLEDKNYVYNLFNYSKSFQKK